MNAATSVIWAKQEFGEARLGNQLRVYRAERVAAAAVRKPRGAVTAVFKGSAEREGAFRFLNNHHIDAAELARSSHEATARRCQHPWVFVAVDQTTLSVTDYQRRKGFGPCSGRYKHLSKKRSVEVMSALAVAPNEATRGLLAQCWWPRSDEPSPGYKQDERPVQERESDLWLQAMEHTRLRLQEAGSTTKPWFQLDRGGDGWRVFDNAELQGAWITVRSAHDRKLWNSALRLHQYMAKAPCRGQMTVVVPPRREPGKRSRPRRRALLEMRYEAVEVEFTDQDRDNFVVELTAVHVTERTRSDERIHWCLLTTYPVKTLADAKLVVVGYAQRWRVEDFHRAWKSGTCNVEHSQLRSAAAFCRWATILAAVATRIEQLKHVSRTTPDDPADNHLSRLEQDAAIALSETRKFKIGDKLTIKQAVDLIAQAGGYTGKSSGGPPGTITLSRGMHDVQIAVAAMERMGNKT